MDRLIYLAMTGSRHALDQQAVIAHNLANVATTGFRAELAALRAMPLSGDGTDTRAFVVASTPGSDFTPGAIRHTERELDVAIEGKGWIAVQGPDGREAYTRAGNLQVSENGLLQTAARHTVLGDGGPIAIPTDVVVTIANDGTISTVPTGNRPNQTAALGRIKLVNPEESRLTRGADGLFRVNDGRPVDADPGVKLVGGALEGSNVNAVEAMVSMIALARQFEMQMKMLQNAEGNERQSNQLLTLNR